MHGRSGSFGENAENFVLYTSPDGKQWDEGTYLFMKKPGCGAGSYSNNVIAHMPGQPRLLIQASKAYRDCRTNIVQYTITKKREKDI